MNEIFGGTLTHLVAAGIGGAITHLAKKYQSVFQNWRNKEVNRVAQLIEGNWRADELFSDDNSKASYTMKLTCHGNEVTGTQLCTSGRYDKNAEFDLSGSFQDLTLRFMWTKRRSVESGTVTARLMPGGLLEGHGLFLAPPGKVYPSTFSATKLNVNN